MPALLSAQTERSASPKSTTDKEVETKLTSLREQLEEATGSEQQIGHWLYAMIERNLESTVHVQERAVHLDALTNALLSKQSVEEAVDWFKPRDSGLHLYHNNVMGVGLHRADKGLHLVSLFDLKRGVELLNRSNTSLFRLRVSSGNDEKKLNNESSWNSTEIQWNANGKSPTLTCHFTDPLDAKLKGLSVVCRAQFHNNLTHWTLETKLPDKGLSLLDSEFPSIDAGPIGKVPEENVLHYPKGPGIATPSPYRKGIKYSETYPNWHATYQMLGLYDQQGGLYIASHDPTGSVKTISAHTEDEKARFRFTWPAPNMTREGNGYQLPGSIVLGSIEGDWYEAAMIYQAWAQEHAPWWPPAASKRPTRIQDIAVWAQVVGDPDKVVPEVLKFAKYMDVPTGFHWYTWHQIPFDNDYPHYFPAKDGFVDGVRELEKAGVRVMPYINGRLWDSELEDFKSEGIKAATKNEKGEPYIEEYGNGVPNAVMCPTTRLWQNKVKGIVQKLHGECGTSGVYLDQIGAGSPALCMDDSHGHPLGGGGWWLDQGYYKLISAIRDEMPKGTFLTTEANAEPYNHLVDGLLGWNFQFQDQQPIYAAIYGGRICVFGRNNPGGPDEHRAVCIRSAQQLVFGEQLGWMDTKILQKKETADFLKKMAQTRHELNDYFVDGQMLAPPVVQGNIPDITADWHWGGKPTPITVPALQRGAWRAKDGRVVQIFVNVSDQTIHFNRPNADRANDDRSDQQKTSLAAYAVKIIKSKD